MCDAESAGNADVDAAKFKVLFLGTGVSSAIPNLRHMMRKGDMCNICADASQSTDSKNRRNNVSIALIFDANIDGVREQKCVLIDAGKTMRDACMRLLPKEGVSAVNAIFLTHGHADAMMGLDDLRDLQDVVYVHEGHSLYKGAEGYKVVSGRMPVYLHKETMDVVQNAFSYLTGAPQYVDEERTLLKMRVAAVDFRIIEKHSHHDVWGLKVRSFPVFHGGEYVSLGFSIGEEGEFVYISDVKIIPDDVMRYLKGLQIKILVTDCLDRGGIFSHMGLTEALALVEELRPQQAFFTGMACGLGDHEDVEKELAAISPNIHLAYDGLVLRDLKM